jgi:hypothetical protein
VDQALQERTFNLIQSSVRNQDLIYFFRGFAINTKAIIPLREFFESNYNSVGVPLVLELRCDQSLSLGDLWQINTRLETTFSMKYIVQVGVMLPCPVVAYVNTPLVFIERVFWFCTGRRSSQGRGVLQGMSSLDDIRFRS